jgi:hypothetical protein
MMVWPMLHPILIEVAKREPQRTHRTRSALVRFERLSPKNVMPAEAGTHDTLQGWCSLDKSNDLTLAWMAACAAMTKLEPACRMSGR